MKVLKMQLFVTFLIATFLISKISGEFSEISQINGAQNIGVQGRIFSFFPNPFLSWLDSNRQRTTTPQPKTSCPNCQCSLPARRRIVGGNKAEIEEFPWAVQILFGTEFLCGAALISDSFVLTAGHCADGFPKQYLSLLFLSTITNSHGLNSFTRELANIVIHPQYNRVNFNNDIALMELKQRIQLGVKISPVCLLNLNSPVMTGETATVVGWGYLYENSNVPSYNLQRINIPIVSNANCQASGLPVTNNMICAGLSQGGKDACSGDSGGPLHVIRNDKYYLAGLVSFGKGCAQPNTPGVYTKVQNYITWIKGYTQKSCFCNGI